MQIMVPLGILLCCDHSNVFCRDTAGQERFNSIRTSFFRGAKVSVGLRDMYCIDKIKNLVMIILNHCEKLATNSFSTYFT